ncbi:MAG: MmcQ/YjbR family DNA-binding protein [Prolixibacteraceae bacterium]
MITPEECRELALSFPGTVEGPHFDRIAFRVINKRIYATLHEKSGTANLKLSVQDQSAFCSLDPEAVYPVPNKWGLQGWTTFELNKVPRELISAALETAWSEVVNTAGRKKS